MMMAELWRKGWPRIDSLILIGSSLYCCGCGKFQGIASIAVDLSAPGKPLSDEKPDYPFDTANCPVCWLTERLVEANDRGLSREW